MSIITKALGIDRMVRKGVSDIYRRMGGSLLQVGFSNAVYSTPDTASIVERAFENILFYSIARRVAIKAAHIPRFVYKEKAMMKRLKAMDESMMVEGELSQLLKRPNQNQGEDQFNYLMYLSYVVCGETYIWKNRGGIEKGKPVELYVIPSWLMTPVGDTSLFGIDHYILEINGQRIRIEKADIIHIKEPSLSLDKSNNSHLRGFNPLIPGRRTIDESDTMQDARVSMVQNGGVRAIIYNETLDNLDDQQQSRLKEVVDSKFNSQKVKSSIAAIQGKWGVLDLSKGAVDMQLIEAEESVIKKMCFLLGFPVELYTGDATHANREQSLRYLLTQTIAPLCATMDAELNRALVPDFKEKGFVMCDMSDLPEMQTMRLEMAKSYQTMWELTPNERRVYMGFEAMPNENMDKVYMPTTFTPIDEASIGQGMDNQNMTDYNA